MDNNEKSYKLRLLKASDLPLIIKILKKIGINKFSKCLQNEEIKKLIEKAQKSKNTNAQIVVGSGVALEMAQVLLEGLDGCFDDLFLLLANISGLSKEQIEELDLATLTNLLIDFIQIKENLDFIKVASKYFNTKN